MVEATFADPAERGLVRETDGGFVFTESGERTASKRFADEFEYVQRFGGLHTDCGPDCWCHDPDHADEECPSEHGHEHAHHRGPN